MRSGRLKFRSYVDADRQRLEELFDEFQDYFVPLDPLGRTRRLEGFGRVALREALDTLGATGSFVIAELDEQIAGFVAAKVSDTTPDQELEVIPGKWGRVTELFVREPFRRGGVGKALMAQAEDFCRKQGCTTVRVEVFAPNQAAHQFYQELGYADRDIDLIKPL
jgi:GNAT superfamily N-acetyltransferase